MMTKLSKKNNLFLLIASLLCLLKPLPSFPTTCSPENFQQQLLAQLANSPQITIRQDCPMHLLASVFQACPNDAFVIIQNDCNLAGHGPEAISSCVAMQKSLYYAKIALACEFLINTSVSAQAYNKNTATPLAALQPQDPPTTLDRSYSGTNMANKSAANTPLKPIGIVY